MGKVIILRLKRDYYFTRSEPRDPDSVQYLSKGKLSSDVPVSSVYPADRSKKLFVDEKLHELDGLVEIVDVKVDAGKFLNNILKDAKFVNDLQNPLSIIDEFVSRSRSRIEQAKVSLQSYLMAFED